MKKIIFFDFDGTLTDSNSWYAFNTHFGMTPEEDHSLFENYVKNSFDYKTWMTEIVRIVKERNLCTKNAVHAFAETIKPRSDAKEVIQACKDADYITVVISGGIKQIIEPVAKKLGVDHVFTTSDLIFDSQGMFETIIDSGDEMHAKVRGFEEVCIERGIPEEQALVVGDSGNNIELFKRTKKGILLGNYEPLKPLAWKQVQSLSEIKELL
jgi:phosphoserine phosphatase